MVWKRKKLRISSNPRNIDFLASNDPLTLVYTEYILIIMNTAVINIKTDKSLKTEIQKIANELGISVSALINGYLKQVTRSQKVIFTIDEKPSRYLIEAIQQARKERKEGKSSPVFDNAEDAIKWLNI